jgi:Zn-dependent protease with chaperone function
MVDWALRREPCPACGTEMENDPRYAFWCDACGWNVARPVVGPRPGPLMRFVRWLGRREGRGLMQQVIRQRAARPRFAASTLASIAIACLVYLSFVGFIALGIALIVGSQGFVTGILFAAASFGLAWLLRPRIPRLEDKPLRRTDLPRTFRLLDSVAGAIGTARVDGVVVTPEPNAGYGRFGIRRERILFLGLPLVAALDPVERIALLGHELGHGINGDPGRLLVIRGAFTALIEVFEVLEPDRILPHVSEGLTGYAAIPVRIVQLAIARAVLGIALLQLTLIFRQSQRAEFHADAIASRLAGSRAALDLLDRLFAADATRSVYWTDRSVDPVAGIASRLRTTSAREIERMRRVEAIEGSRLDATHPPTGDRQHVIRSLPPQPGTMTMTAGESAAIDAELERFRAAIGQEIREASLNALG